MKRECLYKLDEVLNLSQDEVVTLSKEYVNPGMVEVFRMLGFHKIKPVSAKGMYIFLDDGRKIMDMTGGNCVLGLGHNHPRVLRARLKIAEENRVEICKSFLSPYVAALSVNIASLLPGDLKYSFFCGSGAEAVEGALKLAQKHHGAGRRGLVYTDHSFHGKTHAAMSVSSMDETRNNFQMLPDCHAVPYGDAKALEGFFISRCKNLNKKPDVCAFILEAVHGTRLIFPPQGYLAQVRKLCDEYDVLLILDEIYTGFGRTGFWFAFEYENIVPDVVCYSKTFGGGKATIAGFTAREMIFRKAYGKTEDSMIHSSTFSGMTEECAAAIETLNIIKDEGLVERAKEVGLFLGEQLDGLRKKHPHAISEVRGRGLLWGIELTPPLDQINPLLEKLLPKQSTLLPQLAGAVVLSELFHRHDILAYLGLTRRNLVVLSPPLLVSKEEISRVVESMDAVLGLGWLRLTQCFISRYLSAG